MPTGIRTARKLRNTRRVQRWHDKDYKKSHFGTALKANPFGGASHAKGIVLEKVCTQPLTASVIRFVIKSILKYALGKFFGYSIKTS